MRLRDRAARLLFYLGIIVWALFVDAIVAMAVGPLSPSIRMARAGHSEQPNGEAKFREVLWSFIENISVGSPPVQVNPLAVFVDNKSAVLDGLYLLRSRLVIANKVIYGGLRNAYGRGPYCFRRGNC